MPVLQLTPQVVANLKCPPGKRHIEYCDTEVKGLMVYCTESKSALPIYKVRVKNERGTNAYPALGTVKDITLPQARRLAKQLKSEHVLAPKEDAKTAPQMGSMVLDAFMRDHYMPHALVHKRSAKKDEQLYRLHIAPQFKDSSLDQISRRDVQVFHNALIKKGQSPASADHSIKLMSRALNLAVEVFGEKRFEGHQAFHGR